MIGLRDRYTTRPRGELALLAGDAIASATAILFVCGGLGGGGSVFDLALVALWAVIPPALGRAMDPVLDRSRSVLQNIVIAAGVGATLLSLIAIGLTLIEESAGAGLSRFARPWFLLTIIVAWGSGFLLFLPRVYLLHDMLVAGLLLLGLALDRSGAAIAMALTILGLAVSASVRHQVHDVFAEVHRPRINLHNARRMALAFAAVTLVVFVAGGWTARAVFPHAGHEPRDGREFSRTQPGSPGAESRGPGKADGSGVPVSPTARADREGRRGPGGAGPDNERIGFARRVQLGALSEPQADPRVVIVAREYDTSNPPERVLRPSLRGNALWRGLTLSKFDALSESWTEETMLARQDPWPEEGALTSPDPAPDGPEAIFEIEIVEPVVPTLPSPYFQRFLLPPDDPGGFYRMNIAGDVFPVDGIAPGTRFGVRLSLHPRNRHAWPDEPVRGIHHDDRYLAVPDPDDLGFDLVAHAETIFGGADTVQDRIERLRSHFEESFAYDMEAYWVPVTGRLREFCLRERVGNCEYFATASALLLRGAGVSTRVVAGFAGWEWDRERALYIVRNGFAHLWAEVYFPGYGWRPLDATEWVPHRGDEDRTNRVGPDELAAAGDAPREGDRSGTPGERSEGAASDGAWTVPSPDDPELPEGDLGSERDPEVTPTETGERSTRRARPAARWISTGPREEPRAGARERGERDESDRAGWRPDDPALQDPSSAITGGLADETRRAARALLLGIAVVVAGLLIVGFLRPRREDLEEPQEDEDPARPRGGIPDPLAGLLELPDDFVPSDDRERVLHLYHSLQRDLATRRRHRKPWETPVEHGTRVSARLPALDPEFTALCAIVYRALYARDAVSPEDVATAEAHARRIRRAAKG